MRGPDRERRATDDGPALVRPYAIVGGRTRTAGAPPIPVEAVVVTEVGVDGRALILERAHIVRLCRRPQSVAEVSVLLQVPVGVIRVLVADLRSEGFVRVDLPPERTSEGGLDRSLLERVLAGLEAL